MDEIKLEKLLLGFQNQGYVVKQSPQNSRCWYLVKREFSLLFALIFQDDGFWTIRDISGSGANEQERLEQEILKRWQ